MLEALVVTLREGIEAALVLAIVLAYLERTGQAPLKRYVFVGLVAAVLASVAAAVLFQALGLDPENEVLEGAVLLVAAAFVGSMVVWMWRTGRGARRRLEAGLERVLAGGEGPPSRRAAWGLAAFTFAVVGREGVEIVLFLSALSAAIGANPLNNVLGGSAGLLLAALLGYLLIRGSLRINLRRFFSVTGAVLLILVLKLLASGIHEWSEVGLLPTTRAELAVIGFFTRETTSTLILVLLIALPAATVLWDAWRARPADRLEGETAPERRKRLAQARRARRWAAAASVAALLACSSLLASIAMASEGYDPAPRQLSPDGDVVRVSLSELGDHRIHKYVVPLGGVNVRFFLMTRPDNSLASAFDACGICPPVGYLQKDEQLICHNCDAPINLATVGQPGGCNPVPLDAVVQGDSVLVRVADLAAGRARFEGS